MDARGHVQQILQENPEEMLWEVADIHAEHNNAPMRPPIDRFARLEEKVEILHAQMIVMAAEQQRLAAEQQRLAAEQQRFAAEQQRLAAEQQRLAAEMM